MVKKDKKDKEDKEDKEDPRSGIYEEKRPWGGFRRYTHNQLSTVKIITVNPGDILSLQIFIPHGTLHRMAGVGDNPSRWLEISFGEFDEDDIVRLEDHYGRK